MASGVLAENLQSVLRSQVGMPPGGEALISLALQCTPFTQWAMSYEAARAIGNVVRDDLEQGICRKPGALTLVEYAQKLGYAINGAVFTSAFGENGERAIVHFFAGNGYRWDGTGYVEVSE